MTMKASATPMSTTSAAETAAANAILTESWLWAFARDVRVAGRAGRELVVIPAIVARRLPQTMEARPQQPAECQPPTRSRMSAAVALGVLPTRTPAASRASALAAAVPDEPDTMAPAWPMVLPSGAVKPAT